MTLVFQPVCWILMPLKGSILSGLWSNVPNRIENED